MIVLNFATINRKSTIDVELEFTKMLAARLIAIMDGEPRYLSSYDEEAIAALRAAHDQDKSDVDLEAIALDQWNFRNPGYQYSDLD